MLGRAGKVALQGHGELDPQRLAVLPEIALLQNVAGDLPGHEAAHVFPVEPEIVGVSQLLEGAAAQFLAGVAEHAAKPLVQSDPDAVQAHVGEADRRLAEGGVKQGGGLGQGLLGRAPVGDVLGHIAEARPAGGGEAQRRHGDSQEARLAGTAGVREFEGDAAALHPRFQIAAPPEADHLFGHVHGAGGAPGEALGQDAEKAMGGGVVAEVQDVPVREQLHRAHHQGGALEEEAERRILGPHLAVAGGAPLSLGPRQRTAQSRSLRRARRPEPRGAGPGLRHRFSRAWSFAAGKANAAGGKANAAGGAAARRFAGDKRRRPRQADFERGSDDRMR